MSDTERASSSDRVAFCQNCGRPLSTGEVRNVGSSVYCEPCLAAKILAADAAGAGNQGGSAAGYGSNYRGVGGVPPAGPGAGMDGVPYAPSVPNPGLAALLGFIPGVGAFYNGQYAKGIVHLIVFAILTTLANQSSIFGLFVAGWIFYQVIEAYHTARARRDGSPLPNPFGLNEIGERLGFGKAWPAGGPVGGYGGTAPPPASTQATPVGGAMGDTTVPPPAANYGSYVPPVSPTGAYPPPPSAGWGSPSESYGVGVPPFVPPAAPPLTNQGWGSSVPTGAILLIGLGVLFLIGNSGFLHGFPFERLIPFLLIGFGVWLFVRKMTETGNGLADDGTPTYRLRLFRAARGPVWIVLTGVLFLLDTFHILSWGRSWPLYIILGGLMTFFERTVSASAAAAMTAAYPYGSTPVAPMTGVEAVPPTASPIVPNGSEHRERE